MPAPQGEVFMARPLQPAGVTLQNVFDLAQEAEDEQSWHARVKGFDVLRKFMRQGNLAAQKKAVDDINGGIERLVDFIYNSLRHDHPQSSVRRNMCTPGAPSTLR